MSAMCYYYGVEQVKRRPTIPVGMIASGKCAVPNEARMVIRR